jgi:Mrp family chromosome partitioning ATPase
MAEADPNGTTTPPRLDAAMLPEINLEAAHLAKRKIVGLSSGDCRSRAFNLLRTRLLKRVPTSAPRLIGVTSATPAAGKSFISVNLALSLAKVADGPVILVDLDLRRGSVATELGLELSHGVRDFLLGEATFDQVGLRVNGLQLIILPTNAARHESAELLAGDRFPLLLQALRAQPPRTIVLFDLPPVFANDDAMLSISHLDGYLLVVDSSETSKAHVEDAMAMLAPATCLGTVLNRYRGRVFDAYGYGYGSSTYGNYYES